MGTWKRTARRLLRQHRAFKARETGGAGSMQLEQLLKDSPRFHMQDGSLTNSWSIQPDTLRYIYSLLPPQARTLETGCGQTTVVFAIAGARHTCVLPDADEAERVRQYCARLGVANNVNFVIASSDKALPDGARIPSDLDFVLIDGAHGFPAPTGTVRLPRSCAVRSWTARSGTATGRAALICRRGRGRSNASMR